MKKKKERENCLAVVISKTEEAYSPDWEVLLAGIYLKETVVHVHKEVTCKNGCCAFVSYSKNWKQSKLASIVECIYELWHSY